MGTGGKAGEYTSGFSLDDVDGDAIGVERRDESDDRNVGGIDPGISSELRAALGAVENSGTPASEAAVWRPNPPVGLGNR